VADPLVGGIDGTSGRHGGCQLRVDADGYLRVSTGDAAFGTNPQDLQSLAGKTLRVDRMTGAGVTGNPFIGVPGDDRIFTYGHRNVQGLALHRSGRVFSVEHGTTRDDEINEVTTPGNYGWDPVPLPYNESVPMTDTTKFPEAVEALWSSGFPTIATSGATFLQGAAWGEWRGTLAVATLKDSSLHLFAFDGGDLVEVAVPAELDGTRGRLRGAELGPGRALYLTTDRGSGNDVILRVEPT
jgi:glucose/arabinose dehydrogenase